MRRNSDNGFTLIELMVTLAVSALIVIGAHTLIQTALTAEQRISAMNRSAQVIRVLSGTFADDIEDAVSLEGTASGVRLRTFEGVEERDVEYLWDEEAESLTRTSHSPFAADGADGSSTDFEVVGFYLEFLTKDGDYQEEWSSEDGLPLSVRLTFTEGGDSYGNRPVVISAVPFSPRN